MTSLKRQRGVTLTEILLGLAVLGAAMIPMYQSLSNSTEDTRIAVTAQYHRRVNDAAAQYIKNNNNTILTAGVYPTLIQISDLKAANLLPSGFASTNPMGQTVCVNVVSPAANTLSALVMSDGGPTLTDGQLSKIAGLIGADGGATLKAKTGVTGSGGAWTIDNATLTAYKNCSGTAGPLPIGHVASSLYFNQGNLVSNYLYRSSVPGHPELTAMSSPLGLVTKTKAAVCGTSGGDATENNRLATDSNGTVLACQDTGGGNWKWQQVGSGYWKDPVANYASLPASGNSTGDVRETLDTQRLFTWTGAAWTALAVDQNGNMTVPGTLTVNNTVTVNGGGNWAVYPKSNNWSMVTADSAGNLNGAPTSAAGSIHANDIYLRSKGQWLSQGGGKPGYYCRKTSFNESNSWDYVGWGPVCPVIYPGQSQGYCSCIQVMLNY